MTGPTDSHRGPGTILLEQAQIALRAQLLLDPERFALNLRHPGLVPSTSAYGADP